MKKMFFFIDNSEGVENLLEFSIEQGGFIGSSIIIAHRPGHSDRIIYRYLLRRALKTKNALVFFPLPQPVQIPFEPQPIKINPLKLEPGTSFLPGTSYRFKADSFEQSKKVLEKIYKKITHPIERDYPIVFIIDTPQKWTPTLEEHVRFLIREAPLAQLSIWLHCPLERIPPDLLSTIGSILLIWPSRYEIDLLDLHFPSKKITLPEEDPSQYMLFFKSKPADQRGWKYKKYNISSNS